MAPRPRIGAIPDLILLGPAAIDAAERAVTARIRREDAEMAVRQLTAGAQKAHPHVIGSQDRPGDLEKAAIARDDQLADEALERGEDPASVGSPHRDAFRRDLVAAETRLAAAQRLELAAETALIATLRHARHEARANVVEAVAKATAAHQEQIAGLVETRRNKLEAEALIAFLDQLEAEPIQSLGYVVGGTANIRCQARPFVSLDFAGVLDLLNSDAEPTAEAAGYVSQVLAERRFGSDMPKPPQRQRVRAES